MRQLAFGRRAGLFALALFLAAVSGAWSAPMALAYNTYAQYARALLGKLPANAVERPDLEAYLDRLASSYRRSKGRDGLAPSELMREAARAQAIDIMIAGKSGHRSRAGHSFDQRFAAYVDATEIYPAR